MAFTLQIHCKYSLHCKYTANTVHTANKLDIECTLQIQCKYTILCNYIHCKHTIQYTLQIQKKLPHIVATLEGEVAKSGDAKNQVCDSERAEVNYIPHGT